MMLSVTPRLIIAELEKRGIACRRVESNSPKVFLEFTDSLGRHRYMHGLVTDRSNAAACRIADDKLLTAAVAARVGIPVPATIVYDTHEEAIAFLEQHRKIVVKPLDSRHGYGVTVNIDTPEKLEHAMELARPFSDTTLLQHQVDGRDIRLLFIGGELAAAAERKPASVIGDGQHTIKELIDITNAQPDRGENYEKKYNVILLPAAEAFLGESLVSYVPADGEEVRVVGPANIGSGGSAIDITNELPARIVEHSKNLLRELDMQVCGIDFLESPEGAYLIEINSSPSFGLHTYPHEGQPRNVTAIFADWLLA